MLQRTRLTSLDPNRESRNAGRWVVGLLAVMVLSTLLPAPQASRGLSGYSPLHTTLEVLSICAAAMVFGISWAVHKYRASGRALAVGMLFLGVAVLDLSHTLSYTGMPDFVTPSGIEKAINFWLAARLLAALALLIAVWSPERLDQWLNRRSRHLWLALVGGICVLAHLWFLRYPELTPRTFIDGVGLTPFKVMAEYVLIALYLLAANGLFFRSDRNRDFNTHYLALAALTMALSEIYFAVYANSSDAYNLLGHVYKAFAYAFLIRALFFATIERPYEDLLESRADLEATLDTLPDLLFEVSAGGTYLAVHARDSAKLAAPPSQLLGRNLRDVMPTKAADECFRAIRVASAYGSSHDARITISVPDGERHFGLSVARKLHAPGEPETFLVLSRDITESVEQERSLAHEAALNAAVLSLQQDIGDDDEAAVLQRGVEFAKQLTGSAMSFIYVVRDDQKTPELVTWSAANLTNDDQSTQEARSAIGRADIWTEALGRRAPFVINDYEQAEGKQGLPDGHARLERLISLPVMEGSQIRMLVGVANKLSAYTDADVQALQILANSVWNLVKRRRQEVTIHRLSEALEQSPYPVVITDNQAIIQYVNRSFTHHSGYAADEVVGRNPSMLKSGQTPAETYAKLWRQLRADLPWQGEFINRRKDGTVYTERTAIYPIFGRDGKVTNYVAHKEDITLQRKTEERILQLSQYDQLTGLLNKTAFEAQLVRSLQEAALEHERLSLAWLDLDNFKAVNDSMGHMAGDELLIELSNRLRSMLGADVVLGRHSGDAFVAIFRNTEQNKLALSMREAIDRLQEPLMVEGTELSISASAGIASYPDDAQDAVSLATAAEVAMYRMKQEGRNGLRFYAPEMQEFTARSLQLSAALKQAIANGELRLVYQPQMSLTEDRLIGAEALLRWQHPQWGNISPAVFIPLAEQSGAITPIGAWVFEQAAQQLATWREAGRSELVVAVNVSAIQFAQPGFVDETIAVVRRVGVPAHFIEIELTEAVALHHPEAAAQKIEQLHREGFRISIDDFGTGYSSMGYLKRLALDKLKIDQSFVREVIEDADDKALVTAIIQMAHSLGMTTIAEGVETEAQAEFLRMKGCDAIQGYWYSRPLEVRDFEDWAQRQNPLSGLKK